MNTETRTAKEIRAKLGLNQEQMAKKMEMPFATYRNKENGLTGFTYREAKKICSFINLSLDNFEETI